MMKNILNIDIYPPKCKALIFLMKRITALSKTVLLSNTFQKVLINPSFSVRMQDNGRVYCGYSHYDFGGG